MNDNNKLRILLVAGHHFTPRHDGLSKTMVEFAEKMPAKSLLCLTGLKDAFISSGTNRKCYYTNFFDEGIKWLKIPELLKLLIYFKFFFRPDIIIIGACWYGNTALILSKYLRIPYIILAHGNELLQLKQKKLIKQRISLEKATKIVAISNYTKGLLKQIGIKNNNVDALYLGANPDELFPFTADRIYKLKEKYKLGNRAILLTVGNLFLRKGQDMVIKSLPAVIKVIPEITYLVVGRGEHEQIFRDLVQSKGLQKYVKFLGDVEDDQLIEIYNICDLFIMTSRLRMAKGSVENFGITFIEANACGKPVIGGNSGGVCEAIIDGKTGLLVDPENSEEIAQSIIKLLRDKQLSKKLGDTGRERVVEELNWQNIGLKMERICRDVIQNMTENHKTRHKICMFLNTTLAGDQRVFKEARTLSDGGYQVTIICNQEPGEVSPIWQGIKVISIRRRPSLFFPGRYTLHWLREAVSQHPDVIHAHDLNTLGRAYIVSKLVGAILVYDSHDIYTQTAFVLRMPFWRRWYYHLKENILIKRARSVILPVPACCTVIEQKYKINNTAWIANMPIHKELIKTNILREVFKWDEETKIIIYEGILAAERGLEQLVESAKYLKPNIVIVIVGNGYLAEELQDLIEDNGLGEKVKLLHPESFEDFEKYCASADVGVMFHCDNSLNSHLSWHTKIFDYLKAGLPVIVSNLSEISRLITKYGVGEVIGEVNPRTIAAAITSMIENKKLYALYAGRTREVIKNDLNWKFEAEKLIRLYDNLS